MRARWLVFLFACILWPTLACAQNRAESVPPSPAHIAGEWKSDVFINPNLRKKQERQFKFNFKQIGNRVFGDALYFYKENSEPQENSEQPAVYGFSGNIDGSYISFEVAIEESNGFEKDLFYGEVSGDQIRFIFKPGNLRPSEFIARRAKAEASGTKP